MKNSLHTKPHLYIILILLFYATFSYAGKGLMNKAMLVSLAIPAVGASYSYTSGDYEGLKELGLECLLTAQVVTLLKNSVGRTRPNGDNDMSFPSGHTAAAFVGASYLHHRYGIVWGAPMYAIAAAIGAQRVNVKDHFWTDVIAGAAIGYATGALFTARYPKVWIEPFAEPKNNAYGIQVKTRFG